MESPFLETRACPSCPGLIAGADPHHLCFECLGTRIWPRRCHSRSPFQRGGWLRLPGRRMTRTSRCRALPVSGVHGSPPPRSVCQDFPLVMTMAAERGSPSAPSRKKAGQRTSANKHGCVGRLADCSSARCPHLTGSE